MEDLSRAAAILFFIFFAFSAQAANSLEAIINEIAWMGGESSYNDEWIELYNNSESPINLEGWILKATDGTPKINLTGTIAGKSFYLLERTDNNTVPDIPADQIYTGALGNTGERLELYDGSGSLIDLVDCSSGWFAGDNKTKQTMERIDSKKWQTSQNPGGTPKAKNSIVAQIESQPPVEPAESAVDVVVDVKHQQPTVYPTGVIINEILPSPEGPDETEEWVEILNQNSFEVDLSNWEISDAAGKITTFTFPGGTKISAQGFLVLSRPTTKITLNNDADGLNLSQPNGNIIDSVNYEKAPQGQSYNWTGSEWFWSPTLTPGSTNVIPSPASEIKKAESSKKELAAISEQISEKSSFPTFFIALTIAIFSGIIILTIKRKMEKF